MYDIIICFRSIKMQECFTVSFTGHRPQKLPWEYDERDKRCQSFLKDMKNMLQTAISHEYCHFMTGMALGIDMLCAEIVLTLKKKNKNVTLCCVIPCLNQEKLWNKEQQKRYHRILKMADSVVWVTKEKYIKGCMQKRNEYMIDHSDVVIGVWDGSQSGTGNTLLYAKKKGCKIKIINPKDYK